MEKTEPTPTPREIVVPDCTPRSPLRQIPVNIPTEVSRTRLTRSSPVTSSNATIETSSFSNDSSNLLVPGSYDSTPRFSKILGPSRRAARRVRKSISVPSLEFKESLDKVLSRVKSAFLGKEPHLQESVSTTSFNQDKVRHISPLAKYPARY